MSQLASAPQSSFEYFTVYERDQCCRSRHSLKPIYEANQTMKEAILSYYVNMYADHHRQEIFIDIFIVLDTN